SIPPVGDDWIPWAWDFQLNAEGNYQGELDYLKALPGDWIITKMYAYPISFMLSGLYADLGQDESASKELLRAKELLEPMVAKYPDDHRYHGTLGIVHAMLGERERAIQEGLSAVEILPPSTDAFYGLQTVQDLTMIYTLLGEQEAALDQLEEMYSRPSWFSPGSLITEFIPWLALLSDHPGYKELVEKYR
ncbi:tetratricopeptide repeat protein, partial [Gemmatimonadota bacterium]